MFFNNLGGNEVLAVQIDDVVKKVKPNGWRGSIPKENIIKGELFKILNDKDEVERVFVIIKAQAEY